MTPPRAALDALGLSERLLERMVQVRRHLHGHPELSNQERATQRYLRDELVLQLRDRLND